MLVTLLYILTFAAVGYVVFCLIMGARSMGAKNRGENSESAVSSNKWMQRRVFGQFAALGLLFLTVWVKKNGG